MDNFKIIYKILKTLEKAMDVEEFDTSLVGYKELDISEPRWTSIMVMLVNSEYVEGVIVKESFDSLKVDISRIRITLKGLEYLNDNSLMKKMADIAKGIIPLVK